MDTLTAMQVFISIHEQGSLTNAAKHLDMSRAKVSRYLEDLEDYLKLRLYQRTTRRIYLTPAGETALAHCQQILALQQSLLHISQYNQPELSGVLRLTISPTLMQDHLAKHIVDFAQQHEQVTLELIASEDTVDLISQQIDVAIRISNDVASGLIAKRLGCCHSVLCATPDYLVKKGTPHTPEDLLMHECLGHRHVGKDSWPLKMPDGTFSKVPMQVKYCSNDATVLLAMTLQHAGICMLPLNLAQPALDSGALVALLTQHPPEALGIHAVYTSRQHMPPLVRRFIDYLSECFEHVI